MLEAVARFETISQFFENCHQNCTIFVLICLFDFSAVESVSAKGASIGLVQIVAIA